MRLKPLILSTALLLPCMAQAALYITIVQGLGGQAQYDEEFTDSRSKIHAASVTMTDADKVASFEGDGATREALMAHFASLNKTMTDSDRAVIYLIGHGSFDGETYKFNIKGPDLTAEDFKNILTALPGRNHFLVNTSSTSGAMLDTLVGEGEEASNPDYVVIAATRNGNERNATHFSRFFAEALTTEAADINKNNSISIQEAFDFADRRVSAYFEEGGRLATEHAQLRGEGADRFNLSRLNALELETELAEADDGLRTLLEQRQAIDDQIEELQLRRSELGNAAYIQQLQALILEAAKLSEQIDALRGPSAPAPARSASAQNNATPPTLPNPRRGGGQLQGDLSPFENPAEVRRAPPETRAGGNQIQ